MTARRSLLSLFAFCCTATAGNLWTFTSVNADEARPLTGTVAVESPATGDNYVPPVVGHKWVMPFGLVTGPMPNTREEIELYARQRGLKASSEILKLPKATGIAPTLMAERGSVTPYRGGVYGQNAIFQYTNNDVGATTNTCGQAAAATMFTYWGTQPVDYDSDGTWLVKAINRTFPPDGIGLKGWSIAWNTGTSAWRMGQILNNYGLDHAWYGGGWGTSWASQVAELKKWVSNRYPVIVVLEVGAGGWPVSGLHYVVVYGYDDKNVYLTNWNGGTSCTWSQFRAAWTASAVQTMGCAGKVWLTWPKGKPNQTPPTSSPGII